MKKLQEILEDQEIDSSQWVTWEGSGFCCVSKKPRDYQKNRETLSHAYIFFAAQINASFSQASCILRSLWIEETEIKRPKGLPRIIGEDGFLRMYALGMPCNLEFLRRIWSRLNEPIEEKIIGLEPIFIEWNESGINFFDVDATPPGVLPKFLPYFRLKKDRVLLERIAEDLAKIAQFEDPNKRKWLSCAVLSHAAAYRELQGLKLLIPSFSEKGRLISYVCEQHLIAEGIKTVSLHPEEPHAKGIYLCQGTEFWPSQPSMLGSILANFAEHGSATQAYAHSWRRIHQQLRLLDKPIVTGHSMGGSLAMQIGLYSHELVEEIYAFNPPVAGERDYAFYHQLSFASKNKLHVAANLDDFAFWRIGCKIIGNVTLFLGKVRWKYYAVNFWDCVLFFPAFFKFIRNVRHAFPAHQRIAALYENWIYVKLTQEEIEKENAERILRFDYLHFLPKLYDPTKILLNYIRKIFKWRLKDLYLRNEIEIIALHERDLLDTLTEENRAEIEKELQLLHKQKDALLKQL